KVDILLLSEDCESVDGYLNNVEVADLRKYHYTWIKTPSRLFYSLTQYHGKAHVCMNCLHRFYKEDLLVKHRPNCIKHSPAHITFPSSVVKPKRDEDGEVEEKIEALED